MGYDICLWDKNKYLAQVPRHNEGSILQFDTRGKAGTTTAEISVTINYNDIYHRAVGKTLRQILDTPQAEDTIQTLRTVVELCGTMKSDNYWDATPGNAGAVAALLLSWATLYPDGIWEIHA